MIPFGSNTGGGQYPGKFVGFDIKWSHANRLEERSGYDEIEPISTLIYLLLSNRKFCNKVRRRPATACRAIVGTRGGAASDKLPCDNAARLRIRKMIAQMHDAKRKFLKPLLQ